jgi:hypothetical protein
VKHFEYLTTKVRLQWDGGDFYLEIDVNKQPMNINELGAQGWEMIGFFPDAHAIGDIKKNYKDGRDGWVPPTERVAVFKRETVIKADDDLDELTISTRARNALRAANITSIRQVSEMTTTQLLDVKDFGVKALKEVIAAVKARGLSITDDMPR